MTADRCLVVAEVGLNHNGSLSLAHQLIDAAAEAGVDAVKFQVYRTDDFIADRSVIYHGEPQYDLFKRCELPDGCWPELQQACSDKAMLFFGTPTGEQTLRLLVELGVPLLKNGSDYLTNLPLIRAMAETGIPTVLSTGMAQFDEIDDAIAAFEDAGGEELTLLHCTSTYPCRSRDVNLRRIATLRQFGYPVGFSDHTAGIVAALGAVALGAVLVEKHFTLSHQATGPDHGFSADLAEMRHLVAGIRNLERNLGKPDIYPLEAEQASRDAFRLSCVAARDLPAGIALREADIVFRRPGTGVPPGDMERLVGRHLLEPVRAGGLL